MLKIAGIKILEQYRNHNRLRKVPDPEHSVIQRAEHLVLLIPQTVLLQYQMTSFLPPITTELKN